MLSLLTVGTPTAGISSIFTNGEIGTDPPLVLLTGVSPKVLVSDLLNHLPRSLLISVLNAGYEILSQMLLFYHNSFFPLL